MHYNKKLINIPAATAEPITPDTLGAIACISRWFDESYLRPSFCTTLALSGTADTPAAPTSGLILLPSLINKFITLANMIPPAVAIIKDKAPSTKINIDSLVRNTSACVEAPTVSPNKMVTISIRDVLAVSAKRFVTPLSLRIFPKNSIPSNGNAPGEIKVVKIKATIGKMIFSSLLTERGGFMRITRSFLEVNKRMMGGWITGTRAIYE